MQSIKNNFPHIEALNQHVFSLKKGALSIKHENLHNYEGVVFYMGIYFDVDKNNYQLNLEWMCLGLDLFGDNLVESFVYKYDNLEKLLKYLNDKYQLKITDIKVNYKFEDSKFPNPIKNKDKLELYTNKWNQFQKYFKTGSFLDSSQVIIYSTLDI